MYFPPLLYSASHTQIKCKSPCSKSSLNNTLMLSSELCQKNGGTKSYIVFTYVTINPNFKQ